MRSFRWIVVACCVLAGVLWDGIAEAKPKSSSPVETETYVRVSDEKMMRISTHTDGSKDTTYFESGTEKPAPPKSGPMIEGPKTPSRPSSRSPSSNLFGEGNSVSAEDTQKIKAIARASVMITVVRQKVPPILSIVDTRGEFLEYMSALSNNDESIRVVGAMALVESGSASVPYLISAIPVWFDDDDRAWACACLCLIGKTASSSILAARSDARPSVQKWLDYALACSLSDISRP